MLGFCIAGPLLRIHGQARVLETFCSGLRRIVRGLLRGCVASVMVGILGGLVAAALTHWGAGVNVPGEGVWHTDYGFVFCYFIFSPCPAGWDLDPGVCKVGGEGRPAVCTVGPMALIRLWFTSMRVRPLHLRWSICFAQLQWGGVIFTLY